MSPTFLTVPIQAKTPEEVVSSIPKQRQVQAIEVWLDQLKRTFQNPEAVTGLIKQLKKKTKKKLIIVCKNPLEKGKFTGSDKEKADLLIAAAHAGADYIDLGLHTKKAEILRVREHKRRAKLIISHHNFDKTPPNKTLQSKIDQMKERGADVIKIATMCTSVRDTERLMELALDLKDAKQKHIILGMGEPGIITRIFAKQIGNELNFVSVQSKTAPGQCDLETMLQFEKVLQ
ncbi:MAG: type I 3-dehydroquinate dehydratase [Chlamydiia bacterium]|nr:type I 3-dehydroquinate dehydratase [Chlamydiia bacterium]